MRVHPIPDDVLAAALQTSVAQAGVISRAELLRLGVRPAQLATAVRRGRWARVGTGMYAIEPSAEPADQLARNVAAVVHRLDPGGLEPERWVASGRTAAQLHGLPLLGTSGRPSLIDRSEPPGHRLGTAALPDDQVVSRLGVRVTSIERTVVDVARRSGWVAGVVTGDGALAGGASRTLMLAVLDAAPRVPGNVAARMAVELANAGSESPLESLGRARLLERDIEAPELQVNLYDAAGLIGRVDHLWRAHGVVGEADGLGKYDRLQALYEEKAREDRLREAGFEVVRYTWAQIFHDPDRVADRVRAAFARADRLRAA